MRSPCRRSTVPPLPKLVNRLTGGRVQRDEARVDGRDEDAALTPALPHRHAAAGEIAVARVARHLGIEHPSLTSGDRVQRDDASERRAQIQRAVDVERRGLECCWPAARRLIRVARAERPGDLERRDVRAIDAVERREPLAACVATVGRPVTVLLTAERDRSGTPASTRPVQPCAYGSRLLRWRRDRVEVAGALHPGVVVFQPVDLVLSTPLRM